MSILFHIVYIITQLQVSELLRYICLALQTRCQLFLLVIHYLYLITDTCNSNTVNLQYHFIGSFREMFSYHFPIVSCLKCTVNSIDSYFHLLRRKSLPTNDFELTVQDLYYGTQY